MNGELLGGCDIVEEMFDNGELAEALGVEQPAETEPAAPEAPASDEPYKSPPMSIEGS